MIQKQKIELAYNDEPAAIDLGQVIAPTRDVPSINHLAGLGIRVTEPGLKQGWDAIIRGRFDHMDDGRLITYSSDMGDLMMEWQRPVGERGAQLQRLTEGSRVQLSVSRQALSDRLAFDNNVRVYPQGPGQQPESLQPFLGLEYKDQYLNVQVLEPSLRARIAFSGLGQAAQERRRQPKFFNWNAEQDAAAGERVLKEASLSELYSAAMLRDDLVERLSPEEFMTFLDQQRRAINKTLHPDSKKSGADEEQIKAANSALDELIRRFKSS